MCANFCVMIMFSYEFLLGWW